MTDAKISLESYLYEFIFNLVFELSMNIAVRELEDNEV